jgi:hypothetical protein
MPKHAEVFFIFDLSVRTERAMTLEITAPQLVLDALDQGCLNNEILANAVADVADRKCVLDVRVIQKNRNGKNCKVSRGGWR